MEEMHKARDVRRSTELPCFLWAATLLVSRHVHQSWKVSEPPCSGFYGSSITEAQLIKSLAIGE